MRLDETDWVLIRELYGWEEGNFPQGPLRVSLKQLAKRTGLHPKTLKLRLVALREGGVIDGPYFEPRPGVLGFEMSGCGIEGPRPKDGASLEAQLSDFREVQLAVFGVDFAYLIFWHAERIYPPPMLTSLVEALGGGRVWKSFSSVDFGGEAGRRIGPLDTDILMALRRPPARSLSAVARELKLPARTVERRARKLVESGAGAMQVRFRPGRIDGALYVHYVVREGDEHARESLARAFPDRIVGPFGSTYRANVGVALPNLDEAERRRRAAEAAPGIHRLDMLLVRDWIYPAAFEEWLRANVAKRKSGFRQGE